MPKDDLRDSSSWSSPPLLILRDIHSKFLIQYEYKEVCTSSQSQVNFGTGARVHKPGPFFVYDSHMRVLTVVVA